MKIFGSLSEIVKTTFRLAGGKQVSLEPKTPTESAVTVNFPAFAATVVQADLVTTADVGSVTSAMIANGAITNDDINAAAGIVDTKLATISTAGKVSNSATTATTVATPDTIVLRDGSGNVPGNITGSAASFTGSLAGDVSGTQSATSVDKIKGRAVNSSAPTNAQTLVWNNTTSEWTPVSISGDVTMTEAGNVQIASGAIVNADVSNTAAIAGSKISPDFGAQTIKTIGNVDTNTLSTTNTATLFRGLISGTGQNGYIEMTGQTLAGFPAPSVSTNARLFAGTDGKLYGYNGGGAAPFQLGAGTGGSGEINAVSNPSANDDTSGWTAGTSHTVTRDTSNSPLSGIVSTAFDLSSSAAIALGSQTSTSGVYDAITMPTGLRNRKLKVEFYYTTPASSAGTWAVAIYKGATKVALSTDSSGDTILPSSVTGGKFTAYFDTDSASAYSLNLVQRTRTGANDLYITNVTVGPGIQPQGAVVSEWVSYTPSLGGISAQAGTAVGRYRRVGNSMEINARFTASGAATGTISVGLPLGFTIDSTQVTSAAIDSQNFGNVMATKSGTGYFNGSVTYASSTSLRFTDDDGGTSGNANYTTNSPFVWANNDSLSFFATIPIAEWAGSGTVQLAQNDVEYAASTSGTWDAAASAAQTVYGPAGAPITGVLGANRIKVVQFQSPIQAGDSLVLEFKNPNGVWVPAANTIYNYTWQKNAAFGARLTETVVGATTVEVSFSQYGAAGQTYGTADATALGWSTSFATAWRVRKSSAGAAVGFGIVSPGVSAGLVSASGLPGNTTGNAIASGFVGETKDSSILRSAAISLVSGVAKNLTSLNLEAGVWEISGGFGFTGSATSVTVTSGAYSTSSDTLPGADTLGITRFGNAPAAPTSTSDITFAFPPNRVILSATTTVYFVASATFSGGTCNVYGRMRAVRVA